MAACDKTTLGCSASRRPKGMIPQKVSDLENDLGFAPLQEIALLLGEEGVESLDKPLLLALAKNLNEEQIEEFKEILKLDKPCPSEPPIIGVEEIKIFPESISLKTGNSTSLLAVVLPDTASNKKVKWVSFNPTVAIVDDSGRVTALTKGQASIMVVTEDGAKMASCDLTVEPACSCPTTPVEPEEIKVDSVLLSDHTLKLTEGEQKILTVKIYPTDATNKKVVWSSDNPGVATINNNGIITTKKAGSATITVTSEDGGHIDICQVLVEAKTIEVTGVLISEKVETLTEGESVDLTAMVTPEDATNKEVLWTSSDESILEVDSNGKVTAKAPGSATIVVATQSGGHTDNCTILVKAATVEVTGISISRTTMTLVENNTEVLTAVVSPGNATDKTIIWSSSDESIATVDEGVVKALIPGSVVITAQSSNPEIKATCSLTVEAFVAPVVPVTGVTLDNSTLGMAVDGIKTLVATVYPTNATNKKVIWSSSNSSIASVTVNGQVSAKAAGSVTITATTEDGGFKANCDITVEPVSVTSVTLNQTSGSLKPNETKLLTATVLPSNATDKTLTWSSSDTSVATVSSTGLVTAKKAGSATITVTTTDGGLTATYDLTVIDYIAVASITLDQTTLNMGKGISKKLIATVNPENATENMVTWTSSDPSIVSVDQEGNITSSLEAQDKATVTITATAEGKSATCSITIQDSGMEGIGEVIEVPLPDEDF